VERAVLLRYHEIALKGANRGWFEERLAINARRLIERKVGKDTALEVARERGRVIIAGVEWTDAVRDALEHVFGVTSFSPMRTVPTDKQALKDAAIEELKRRLAEPGRPAPRTFRIFTRRSDKALPETSMELDREIGSAVQAAAPHLAVDLEDPELTIGIELHHESSYLWTEKIPGPGGLPVGTNGHLLCLLSGGLDSPVAAIQLLKRGAATSFLHFYGAPFVGAEVLEKVEDLARIVGRFQPEPRPLYVVPFGKIQEKIALATNPKLRTVIYRRMMFRIASALAREIEAQALVTGESLGQVASQTIENIATIDAVASLPVFRPLIGFDKDEIIDLARGWGTFETAIRPGVDCCTLFADRHPSLRTSEMSVEEQEKLFPVDELVREALASVERRRL
jgi:thiamine biosynthesis protein ThiI